MIIIRILLLFVRGSIFCFFSFLPCGRQGGKKDRPGSKKGKCNVCLCECLYRSPPRCAGRRFVCAFETGILTKREASSTLP